jgi:hypothetical protein
MDPTNERRVFELLVKHSSDKANSQYFLLSPKVRKTNFPIIFLKKIFSCL